MDIESLYCALLRCFEATQHNYRGHAFWQAKEALDDMTVAECKEAELTGTLSHR